MPYKFKQYDKVKYKITEDIQGVGFVMGVTTNALPVIGCTYIIKDLNRFPNANYPFECFGCFECMMELIEKCEDSNEPIPAVNLPIPSLNYAELGRKLKMVDDLPQAKCSKVEVGHTSDGLGRTIHLV